MEFSYLARTNYAISAFLPISAQTWACLLLSDGSACCTISSLFKDFCVLPVRNTFCKSLANTSVLSSWLQHLRKPDERNSSQGKLWISSVHRWSSPLPLSQVFKGLCFLNWRSRSAEEDKWRKELKVCLIWGVFLDPSLYSPPPRLSWRVPHPMCISYLTVCVCGFARYCLMRALLSQSQYHVYLHISSLEQGVWQSGQDTFIVHLLCARHRASSRDRMSSPWGT